QKFLGGRVQFFGAEPTAAQLIAERPRAARRKHPTVVRAKAAELSLNPTPSAEPAKHANKHVSAPAQPLGTLDQPRLGRGRQLQRQKIRLTDVLESVEAARAHQRHQRRVPQRKLDGEKFRNITGVEGLDAQRVFPLDVNLEVERHTKLV